MGLASEEKSAYAVCRLNLSANRLVGEFTDRELVYPGNVR